MPERPDLEYVVDILNRKLRGVIILDVEVRKPVVLRVALPGKPQELLGGCRIQTVTRRGHFIRFELQAPTTPVEMVISPMLAGRFALAEDAGRAPDLAVCFHLQDGRHLHYRDEVQMGKVYLVAPHDWSHVPGLTDIGVDVLNPQAFTPAAFRALAHKRREQAKVFLMDKSLLDSLGNAYADEVLFAAGIHPKTRMSELDEADLDRLHAAIVHVMTEACQTIRERKPPLHEKVRDFLSVRNRHGENCPRCGTTIRRAGVHGHDAFFCPTCQPESRKSLVDWKKIPSPR